MAVFPLEKKVDSYKTVAPCKFGAPRGSRKHAGCDLGIGAGSAVLAVAAGEVIEAANTGFYTRDDKPINIGVVSIKHGAMKIGETEYEEVVIRYGEVDTVKVAVGAKVAAGDPIARVAKQADEGTQLHLELYLGKQGISASTRFKNNTPPFYRAFVPTDPTALLDSLPLK